MHERLDGRGPARAPRDALDPDGPALSPPPPWIGDAKHFEPYGVELPEGVRVESRLTAADPDALAIGMEMELVLKKFVDGPDGDARMTFAFAPVASGGR